MCLGMGYFTGVSRAEPGVKDPKEEPLFSRFHISLVPGKLLQHFLEIDNGLFLFIRASESTPGAGLDEAQLEPGQFSFTESYQA